MGSDCRGLACKKGICCGICELKQSCRNACSFCIPRDATNSNPNTTTDGDSKLDSSSS